MNELINNEKNKNIMMFLPMFVILFLPFQNYNILNLKIVHYYEILYLLICIIMSIKLGKILSISPSVAKLSILLYVFLIMNINSLLVSENVNYSVFRLIKLLFAYMILFLVLHTINNCNVKQIFKYIKVGYFLSSAIILISVIIQLKNIGFSEYITLLSINALSGSEAAVLKNQLNVFFGGGINLLGTWIANSLLFIVMYNAEFNPIHKLGFRKLLRYLFYGINIYILILTSSRTAMIGLSIGLTSYFFVFKSNSRKVENLYKKILITLLCIIIIIAFNPFSIKDIIYSRFIGIMMANQDGGVSGRVEVWKAAQNMILNSPFLGNGIGSIKFLAQEFNPNFEEIGLTNAHNIYLQYFAESGFISILSFILFIIGVIFIMNKCRKSKLIDEKYKGFIILTQVICITYITESMFQFEGNDIDMWMWFGIALGLINNMKIYKNKFKFNQQYQKYE